MSKTKGLDYDEVNELRQRAAANDHLRVGGPVRLGGALSRAEDEAEFGPAREVACAGACGARVTLSGFAWWVAKILVKGLIEKGVALPHPVEDHALRCDKCQGNEAERRTRRDREAEEKVNQALKLARDDEHGHPNGQMVDTLRAMRKAGFSIEAGWIEEIYRKRRDEAARPQAPRSKGRGYGRRGLDETIT